LEIEMQKFRSAVKKFVTEEDAPTMVEYGLLVALIAVVVAVAATVLGTGIAALFTDVNATL